MGLSTSSVSRLGIDLEGWQGTSSMRRTTRHVALTDVGEQFWDRCDDIVNTAENLKTDARTLTYYPHGSLTINVLVHGDETA